MAVGERIDSGGRPGTAEDGLVQYAFRRLYESGDVENTVQDILALVGRRFNVSRTYIFENTRSNRAAGIPSSGAARASSPRSTVCSISSISGIWAGAMRRTLTSTVCFTARM